MGTVWMAQQIEPVKRLVAIKLIKAGMDSKQVIARFEAERQALALMDHANIARVLDAGMTGAGRPYFVMDLVKGVPITKYCDEHHLTPRQRLELFIPVCQAVQHAHQKGIIHRDLKPSNVLIALYDGKPVPKIIEFGVAKAAGQQLTDKTLVTGFAAIIGTLEYMSPEQAEVNQLDIDTRSDVYSLGVLLYELLAGSPPFNHQELQKAGMLEMLRVIREQEPSKPSTKLSTAEGLPTLAANRGTEPAKLTKLVRGELDWIVMKALEKDRNRRYETANAFARDIERYLNDEQVVACPPSASYRLHKFARRNKVALGVAAVVLFCLVLMGGGAGWAVRNRAAHDAELAHEEASRRARLNLEIEHVLADATKAHEEALTVAENPYRWETALHKAAYILKRAKGLADQDETAVEPSVRERLEALQAILSASDADYRFAARLDQIRVGLADFNEEAGEKPGDPLYSIGEEFRRHYQIEFDLTPVSDAVSIIRQRPEPVQHILLAAIETGRDYAPPDARDSITWLTAVIDGADTGPWRKRAAQAVEAKDWKALEKTIAAAVAAREPASFSVRLASVIPEPGIRRQIKGVVRRAYPGDFWANYSLAYELLYFPSRRPAEAIAYLGVADAVRPHTPVVHLEIGNALKSLGDLDGAISAYGEALDTYPGYAAAHEARGFALRDKGDLDGCIAGLREAIRYRTYVPDHTALGDTLAKKCLFDEAIAAYEGAINIDPQQAIAHRRGDDADLSVAYNRLAVALLNRMQPDRVATAFHRGLETEPTNHMRWCYAAAVDAAVGDVDAYRRTCRGLLERFGETTSCYTAERSAKACLLLPDALGSADFERVQELAEGAVTGTEQAPHFGLFAMAKGLADYRARRYAESIEWIKRADPRVNGVHFDATKFAVLAMAHHKLGHANEAATALANAKEIMVKMPDPAKGQLFAGDWFNWGHAQVVYREAEALLMKSATETGP
jgi:tetratricopeptide (TPR) repeat protein